MHQTAVHITISTRNGWNESQTIISVHYVALQLDLATFYPRKPVNCEISFIQE